MQLFAQLRGMDVMYYQSKLECFRWTNLDGLPAQDVIPKERKSLTLCRRTVGRW